MTSTGRVGNITAMQIDCISKTYACEVKQIKVWAGLWGFWKKIVVRAAEYGKEPLMKIEPTNEDSNGVPNFHIITEDRHAELLDAERELRAIKEPADAVVTNNMTTARPFRPYSKDMQLRRRPKA